MAWAWGAVVLVLFAFLLIAVPRVPVSADVMELLPREEYAGVSREVTEAFADKMARQAVFAVAGPEAAAERFSEALSRIDGVESVAGKFEAGRSGKSSRFLYAHRAAFLSAAARERLADGGEHQAAWVLSQLFSPVAGVSADEARSDPLLLMRSSTLADIGSSRLSARNGWLAGTDDSGTLWRLINAEISREEASASRVSALAQKIRDAEAAVKAEFPEAKFASQGAVFYSEYAGSSAKADMAKLGSVSVVLLLILLVIAFRSVTPLALCLVSIAVGAAAGAAVTILVFQEIHMITLMMSLSLIGISADYTTHYFTARMTAAPGTSTVESMERLRPVLFQALATTCAAYAAMLLAPFPGLRQLGVFSVAGLAAAFVTVALWYPLVTSRFKPRKLVFADSLRRYVALWTGEGRYPWIVLGFLAVFAAGGILLAGTNDDLGAMQAAPADLKAREAVISQVTGRDATQRWFIVTGKTPEEALQRKDALVPGLAGLRADGMISGATILPLNSIETQKKDEALIREALPAAKKRLAEYGIRTRADYRDAPLELQVWLQDYLSSTWGRLIIGGLHETAILIPVQAERNPATDQALAALARSVPGAAWVDRRADFGRLFGEVRTIVSVILALSGLAIFAFYSVVYSPKRGFALLVPCALAVGSGLGVLGWAGLPVNVFSLFGLILILGVGIDYSLFFSSFKTQTDSTLFAVVTAMLTTVISLGILVFSGTAAVANFGLVLTAGILAAFLAAPFSLALDRKKPGSAAK